jgi:ring-1,2-phenylacetyl-CoA epoxidase subunit PaaC
MTFPIIEPSANDAPKSSSLDPERGLYSEKSMPRLKPEQVALLRIADSALIHSQRLSQWCGHAPMLEEDLALSNIALDLLGQARMLYQHLASHAEIAGRDEDWYAYWRDEKNFFNLSLVELPNGLTMSSGPREDYAVTVAKLFTSAAYFLPYWSALSKAPNVALAEIAQKSLKEARYHWDHAAEWILRMGDGTAESNRRAQLALDRIWPYCNELFADDDLDREAKTKMTGVLPSEIESSWNKLVDSVLAEGQLKRPSPSKMLSRGKLGEHTEAMGFLLAEMQSIARQHPGASW